MPKSKNRRKPTGPDARRIPTPELYRIPEERLRALGIGITFSQNGDGRVFARLLRYENGFEDGEALLMNAVDLSDEEWADYLRPTLAWLCPAPEKLRGKGALMLIQMETVQADGAPCPAWFLSPERPEDLPAAIREAIAEPATGVSPTLIDFEATGADLDLNNLTLFFDEYAEQTDPLLAAVHRAWLPAHPFSDPEDMRLARALARDVGHGRHLLISGDLLTAGDAPRLIDRYDLDTLIEELGEDYDLTDPMAAADILGREHAEEIADLIMMDADEIEQRIMMNEETYENDDSLMSDDDAQSVVEDEPGLRTLH